MNFYNEYFFNKKLLLILQCELVASKKHENHQL
jgi:hypothetical protein